MKQQVGSRAFARNTVTSLYEGTIIRAEQSVPLGIDPDYNAAIDGYTAAWPIRNDGTAGRWMLSTDTFNAMLEKGYVSLGRYDDKRGT